METRAVRRRSGRLSDTLLTLLVVGLATALLMLAYEATKQLLFPGIGIWTSHAVTIGFTTALAVTTAWFAQRHLAGLNRSLESLVAERTAEVARVHESEAHKDAILRSALDGIVSMDEHGTITEFNAAAERTFGLTRSAAVGRSASETLVPPVEQDAFRTAVQQFLVSGPEPAGGGRIETTGLRADGSEFPMEIAITRVDVPGPPEFTAFMRDISARRKLEAQLHRSERMQSIGRLAGGVAHDFNNLLTLIMGHTSQLQAAGRADEAIGLHATGIQEAADRAGTLTRQLLAFSRQQVMQPSVVNLNAIVRDLDRMLRRIVSEDVEIAVLAANELESVRVDRSQIEQVIVNLVVNAKDAMPQGGKLTIETANVDLDETYSRAHDEVAPGPYVMMAVSDTGSGMDAATLGAIFEPFFTTKELGRGTGLGLSIVHGIVTQSGGHVWAYSEHGKGTSVKVYLPKVDTPAESPRISPAGGTPRRGSETILLVEDDGALRRLAELTLASLGYRVITAENAVTAEKVWSERSSDVDLLLTDVVMPGVSGWDLAQRLRQDRADLKVICMSGYAQNAMVRSGTMEAGIAFLQKPFSPSALSVKIRDVLEGVDLASK